MIIANLSRKQKRAAQDIGNKVLTVLLTISMVLQSSPVSYAYALEESVEPEVQVVEPAPEEEEAVVEAAPEQEAAPAAEEPAPAPEPEAASAPEPEPAPAQESAPAPAEPETTPEPAATPEPSAPAKAADTKTTYTFENDNLKVTAVLEDATAVPDSAKLQVTSVKKDSTKYNYDAYMKALNDAAGAKDAYTDANTYLYDVAFLVAKDGKNVEVQPTKGWVKVTFEFKRQQVSEGLKVQSLDDLQVIHLPLRDDAKADTTADATGIAASDVKVEQLRDENLTVRSADSFEAKAKSFSIFAVSNQPEKAAEAPVPAEAEPEAEAEATPATTPEESVVPETSADEYGYVFTSDDPVLLSEILSAAGLDVTTNDVYGLSAADESVLLVALTEDGADWTVAPAAAFDGIQQLIVEMYDGSTFEIAVTYDVTGAAQAAEPAAASKSVYFGENDDVRVVATLDDPTAIPDDATLMVTNIVKGGDGYSYDAYMEALNQSAGEVGYFDETNTLLYDVAFMWTNENGETVELQPAEGTVHVSFRFKNAQLSEMVNAAGGSDATVRHLPVEGEAKAATTAATTDISAADVLVETVEQAVSVEGDTASVTATSFSAYAFTVDFMYDGFTFSMPGMENIALSELFGQLGIEEDAANATSVVFSDPELVEVAQAEDGSDWTLTSKAPFDTEETLVVTMASGKTYVVVVTDAQSDGYLLTLNIVDKDESTPIQPGTGDAPAISENCFARVYLTDSEGYIAAWGVAPLPTNYATQQVYVNEFHKLTHEVTTDDEGNEVVTYSDTADDPITFAEAVAAGYKVEKKGNVRVAHGDAPTNYETANALDVSDPDGYTFASHNISGDPYDTSVVTIHVNYDTAYYVRLVTEDGGSVAIPDSPYIYAWVTVKHSTGEDTISAVRLTSDYTQDGGKTYNLPITKWYFKDGRSVENESISGHEVEVSVQLYTAMEEIASISSSLIESKKIRPITVGNSVGKYVVKSYPVVPKDYVEPGNEPMRHIDDDDTNKVRDIYDIVYLEKGETGKLPKYTLEYVLNGYNAVTLCPNDESKIHTYSDATYTDGDVYLANHMMGGVLVRGDLIAGGGTGIADSEYASKPSFINGAAPTYGENGFIGANTRGDQPSDNVSDLYLGEGNTVYGNVINGVNSGDSGYNHNGSTALNDTFVDWDKLNQVVKSTCASMAELTGTTVAVSYDWQEITLSAGRVYYLDNPNNFENVKIKIVDYNPTEGATATIINDLRSGSVVVPQVVSINGENIQFKEDEPDGVSIVFNYPNASIVDIKNSLTPEVGHVVAPYADMHIEGGNYNGCMVVNSLYTKGEGHLWPYKGDTLVPASFGFQLTKKVNGEDPTSSQVYTFKLQKWTGSGWATEPTPEDKNTYQEKDNEGSAINFDEIIWTQTGRYFYLISEKTTGDEYTVTDGTKFIVQVDVTSKQQESSIVFEGEETYYKVDSSVEDLSSLIRDNIVVVGEKVAELPNGESDAQFINKVVGNLKISKTVEPVPTTEAGKNALFVFVVTLINENDGVTLTGEYDAEKINTNGEKTQEKVTVDAAGKVSDIELKHGESLEIKGLPAGTTYTVTEDEKENPSGYSQAIPANSEPARGTIEGKQTSNADFVNAYDAKGTATVEVAKHLTGRDLTDDDEFTFTLSAVGDAPLLDANGAAIPAASLTVSNGADGALVAFPTLNYGLDHDGNDYVYRIVENSFDAPGVTKDTTSGPAEIYAKVSVPADDGSGSLGTATVEYFSDEACTAKLEKSQFVNAYDAKGTATVEVAKHLTGRDLTDDDEFTFTLSAVGDAPLLDANGAAIPAASLTVSNGADGALVAFPTLNYGLDHDGNDYVYRIVENSFDAPGVTKDTTSGPAEIYAKVSVPADDGSGSLGTATVEYFSDEACTAKLEKSQFVNAYDAKGTESFEAHKDLTGRSLAGAQTFNFTFTDVTDPAKPVLIATKPADTADGKVDFGSKNYTLADLGTHIYEIAEVVPGNAKNAAGDTYASVKAAGGDTSGEWTLGGYTYDGHKATITVEIKDDVRDGKLEITKTVNPTGSLTFTNKYAADDSVSFTASKTIDKRAYLDTDDFKFTLTNVTDAKNPVVIKTESVDKTKGTVDLGSIAYGLADAGNTYTYEIAEVVPKDAQQKTVDGKQVWVKDGITYDGHVVTVTVSVVENADGTITATETYTPAGNASFTNKYAAETDIQFFAQKDLSGRDLKAGEFSFKLTGEKLPAEGVTVANDASGRAAFDAISFSIDDLNGDVVDGHKTGEFTFTITEVMPDDDHKVPGVTYSSMTAQIKAKLTDNGDGTMKVEYERVDSNTTAFTLDTIEGVTAAGETFENTYAAKGTATVEVAKHLTGRTLNADEFSFTIGSVNGAPMNDANGNAIASTALTVKNAADGTVAFPTFNYTLADAKQVYVYKVAEDSFTISGVTRDTETGPEFIYAQVTVGADNGDGTLKASTVKYFSDEACTKELTAAEFVNKYDTKGDVTFSGTKTLENRKLKEGEFTFELYGADDKLIESVTNAADGSYSFSTINYSGADLDKNADGTYKQTIKTYTVVEQVPEIGTDKRDESVTYDSESYVITVTLKDNGNGTMTVTADPAKNTYNFKNTYTANGTITLGGTKELANRTLKAGEFTFELCDSNGTVIDSTTNEADGSYAFEALTYDLGDLDKNPDGTFKETTKTYTVTEKPGNDASVKYDETTYNVTVTLKDNGKGTIDATADPAENTYNFKNEYHTKGDITFSGTKTLENRKLKEGEFTFELYGAKGELIESVTNAADGSYSFSTINYSGADLEKNDDGTYKETTKTYKVVEKPGDDASVKYDETEYSITVTLRDNGSGAITTTANPEKNTYNFTNTYDATGTTTLSGAKTVDGREFKAGDEATMKIEAITKGAPMPKDAEGNEVTSITVKPEGGTSASFSFPEITYQLSDIPEGEKSATFEYKVTEDAFTMEGVAVKDSTEYTVTVTISDNGDGTLKVVTSDNATGLIFTNTYAAEGSIALEARKDLTGRELKAGQFSFKAKGAVGDKNVTMSAKNDADGNVKFGELEFTQDMVGTYEFTISETIPAGATDNGDGTYTLNSYTYDGHSEKVTITVADNGDGTLDVKAEYANKAGAVFKNAYEVSKDSVIITATKKLNGRALVAREFTFQLRDANGKVLQTKTNDGSGRIYFDEITFGPEDAGKTFDYTIVEVKGNDTSITYDTHVAKVRVVVKLVDGKVEANVGYSVQSPATFVNTYKKKRLAQTDDPTNTIAMYALGGAGVLAVAGGIASRLRSRKEDEE